MNSMLRLKKIALDIPGLSDDLLCAIDDVDRDIVKLKHIGNEVKINAESVLKYPGVRDHVGSLAYDPLLGAVKHFNKVRNELHDN